MKAWILHDIDDIRYEDIEKTNLDAGEVLVKVKAVGICGSDIPRIYRDGAHNMPLIPGHEFSGEVVDIKDVSDGSWIGKHVGVFPLIPCSKCNLCLNKQYEMCKNYSYLGSRRDGAFAEYVAVPKWNLIELPGNVSFEQAAMLEPMSVAVHAMRRCLNSDLIETVKHEKKSVLVYGLGTIGLMLTMFLIDAGVENLLVVGNKESQRETAIRLGLDGADYCDSKQQNVNTWINDKTAENGVDFIFECVGRCETVTQVIDLAAPLGRVMLIGNPYSDMTLEKKVYWKILRNQLTVLGTWNSSFTHDENDDWHYVLKRLQTGCISPQMFITHKYSLKDLEQGLLVMRDKSEEYIKEMVVMQLRCED